MTPLNALMLGTGIGLGGAMAILLILLAALIVRVIWPLPNELAHLEGIADD